MQSQNTLFQVWSDQPNLAIRVEADWDSLYTIKDESPVDATMFVNDREWDIKVNLRGRYRRATCAYPPFRLDLRKKDLEELGLKDFDKFKVVTRCIEDKEGINNIYEELLIYELFQIITDESFRVLHCSFTYAWPGASQPDVESEALIIEPNNELEWRLGMTEYKKFGMTGDSLDYKSYLRTALFEMMIGNYDWDLNFLKNLKLLLRDDGKYIIVPYDFDFSAIVYPEYARLNPDDKMLDFRDRIYYGKYFNDEFSEIKAEFLSKKDELLEHVRNFELLKKSRQRWIMDYLDSFFEFLEDHEGWIPEKTLLRYDGEG